MCSFLDTLNTILIITSKSFVVKESNIGTSWTFIATMFKFGSKFPLAIPPDYFEWWLIAMQC